MMLVIHILVAVMSLAVVTYAYAKPSQSLLRVVYGLVGATLVTGTALVAMAPGHLMSACASGLVYLGLVFAGLILAQRRLAGSRS